MEAETAEMGFQVDAHKGWPAASRGWVGGLKLILPETLEGSNLSYALISVSDPPDCEITHF